MNLAVMLARVLAACMLGACCLGAGAWAATVELTQAQATISVDGTTVEREVVLPYHWDRLHATHAGDGVFDLRFAMSPDPTRPYGIYFPRVGNTAEIWLNGALLARLGDLSRPNSDDYSKGPQYVAIPPRLLQQDNLLRVRLHADAGRRGGLATVLVGPESEVGPAFRYAFRWRVTASQAITIFSLLVAAVALGLWLTQADLEDWNLNRRDGLYLTAALAELCWSVRVGDVTIEQNPVPWPWWGVVMTAVFAGWICCSALFAHRVAGWHRHRSMPAVRIIVAAVFGSSILASTLSFTLQRPIFLTTWLGFANAFFLAYTTFYFFAALRRPEPARLMVAIAGAVNLAIGVRDWLAVRINGSYADSTWIRYSSALFALTLGYIVITRFRTVSGQARDLMANLAARVAQKEAELQRSYERVEQLAREQERAAERTRILRDLHDGVGSHISSAIRQLQSGKASADDVLQTLRDSMDQLKLSIDAMHVPAGDITVLLANLRYRLEPRFAASDVELQWNVDLIPPLQRLDANAMRQLQFMVFEALSNVLQHAGASMLRIEASALATGARLRIVDNGKGFDVDAPLRNGLASMRARAALIGAVLTLASEPGRTVVEILLE